MQEKLDQLKLVSSKKYILGIKPSRLHLGHILGAFAEIVSIQNEGHEVIVMIGDYHRLTTEPNYNNVVVLTNKIVELCKKLGINYYLQSSLSDNYTKLFFMLGCIVTHSSLQKIFEINKYNGTHKNANKYIYPLLMTADIVLMSGYTVLVGIDQIHNIRLAKKVCDKIGVNFEYQFLKKQIPDFQNPKSKMSTSHGSGTIYLDSLDQDVKNIVSKVPSSGSDVYKKGDSEYLDNLIQVGYLSQQFLAFMGHKTTYSFDYEGQEKCFSKIKSNCYIVITALLKHIQNSSYKTVNDKIVSKNLSKSFKDRADKIEINFN